MRPHGTIVDHVTIKPVFNSILLPGAANKEKTVEKIPNEQSLPCHDAHIAVQLTDTLWLAAVADGIGSAACSEKGSAKAVTALAEFCSEAIQTYTDWAELLKDGFCKALDAVVAMAQEEPW